MEAPISASLGAMGSLLGKLDVLLAPEYRLPKEAKDGIQLLRGDLQEIATSLVDLSEAEDPTLTAKCWMKDVRELSYDMEDYVDELLHSGADAKAGTVRRGGRLKIGRGGRLKIGRLPWTLKRQPLITNRVSEFRSHVQEAIQRHERYNLGDCISRCRHLSVGPMLPTEYTETDDLFDGPRNELLKWLTNEEEQQLKVVSIVGSGGLGKTTLARKLYHILGGRFDCRAFLRTSQKPDMKRLLVGMLSQLRHHHQPPDVCEVPELIHTIRTHLHDKRYLIVIDDLWATSLWNSISHAFPEGNHCSRIITTTQIEEVALTCCSYHQEYLFKMTRLNMDQSRKLFFKRVFGSEDDCPQQFRGISLGIIKRCGGLPLAIISIASLLASQPVLLMEQWEYIQDSLLASNLKISTSEGMRQVLNLSYDNLPHYLKTCLLYLNTYPEDYTILKDDLVKQWVAEGFINAIEGEDVEEVAGSYFDELVNRRMIQPMDTNYKHEVFMVHGMLLDLIAYKSMEDNFSTAVDYSQNTIGLCDKVRRLSCHFGSAKYAKAPASIGLSQVRSLAFFGLFKSMPPITEFNLLRVLILQIWGDCRGTSVDLTRICELHQLRYLRIACDVSIEIPTLMQRLQCLETVEIYARLTTVPLDIVHLPRLLHLCLPGETNLLGSVGHMTSLRRLGYLDLSSHSVDTVHSLGELTNLRNLHLACCTVPSDHLESNMQCLGSILGKLSNLKSLTLVSTSSRANILVPCDGLSFVSPVPCLLQRLELLPRICIFSSLPKWIGGLGELCTLKIAVRELPRNDVDTLKRLSTLTILSLCVEEVPLQRITFHSMEFPVLRYFKFRCREAYLTFQEGAMPNLRRLKLGFNAHGAEQHSRMPTGLENLLSLEELTARIGDRGATESDRRAAESALTTMIGVHPRCPGVNIFWVDWIFYLNESISRRTQEEGSRILEEEHGILEIEPEQEYGIAQRDEKQKYYRDEEGDTSNQGRGGHYQGRGGPHHPGGGPPEYQPREYQRRGGPRPRGGRMPQAYYGGHRGGGMRQAYYGWHRGGGMPHAYYGGHRGGGGGRNVPPGPSRTVPELHQAPHVQYQAPVFSPSPSRAGSLSRPAAEVSRGQVQQQFQQLAIRGQISTSQAIQLAPPSSKSVRFPLRPGKGTYGDRCIVKANHFFVELPDKDLHQYDVSITPDVTSRGVNRAVMRQLVTLYRQSHLGGRLPAYDGRKSLYTAGTLPFTSRKFEITLQDKEDSIGGGQGGQRRERLFRVVIKFAARADLHHLAMFLAGRQADAPQEALQVLDIVLRELPTARYFPVARSFYSPNLGRRQQLGGGLESWCGFYQSIRPTQMGLSLNIDMSSTAFIEPLPVIDFVAQLLNRDISVRPLSDSDRVKIKEALRGVKIEVTHRNTRRKYRISGLTSQATRELSFPVDDRGTVKTVFQYFLEKYGFSIQHTTLPCLQVGNQQRPTYLPMEVCKIVEGQRYSNRLNDKQKIALRNVTCQRPQKRELDILQTVHHNAYYEDPYAQEFGIRIDERLASVEARVLPPPRLKYHDSGREKDVLPRIGQWNMTNKKMVNGGRVSNWACINFSQNVQDSAARGFCHELAIMCQVSGMDFALEPVLPPVTARPEHVERALKARYQDVMNILRPKGREPDLLIVILPDNNGSLYGDLKRICETDLGLVSQCCLTKHVFKISKQYLANVALKINVKVGGRNTVLVDALTRRIPLVSDRPTIIFGADVTHPHPREDSSPSIAAVVASQDWPEVTKYAGLVSAQAHRQELIQDLFKVWQDPQRGTVTGGMIRELLISFKKATGQKPQRIIFYRDGVSEGQFYQVLMYELDAIRKACASLEPNYQPAVTFVVVQKRPHTRLFANNHNNQLTVDRSGNILPGTVVDSRICHPTEFDFYLCSHAGIQGTSRPAHYHVLWDENKFTADELQTLTNNLCYTYARCTRSVSIVPPAYYAHLLAFRARFYMEPETSDSGSMASGAAMSRGPPPPGARSTRAAGNVAVRPLPDLKENVKRVMFYC